jgi:FMN phosphatase YigB (HAD superfamily)
MKYLAVDLGDVICKVDFDNFKKQLSIAANISLDDAEYFLNRTQKSHDLGMTSISDELHDHFKIKSEPLVNGLVKEWNKTIAINSKMKHFLEEMITKGVNVALLSNIGIDHSSVIRSVLGETIYDNSIRFFSCNIGVRKPTYLYYKTFIDMYSKFAGCLYIDDIQENIDTAKLFGLNAINFSLSRMDDHELEEKLKTFRSL